jgi:hypothetical protein
MITYIEEPLEIGRRGSMGRRLNGYALAAVNGHLLPFIRFAGASYTWYDNVHSGTVGDR